MSSIHQPVYLYLPTLEQSQTYPAIISETTRKIRFFSDSPHTYLFTYGVKQTLKIFLLNKKWV